MSVKFLEIPTGEQERCTPGLISRFPEPIPEKSQIPFPTLTAICRLAKTPLMNLLKFAKDWTLPISMLTGVAAYFLYVNIPFLEPTRPFVNQAVHIIQPLLIFAMLFLTFCKVDLHEMKLCKWHGILLLIQLASFFLFGAVIIAFRPEITARVLWEGAMICLICPTATAGAVVTRKLGGSPENLTTYTILINLFAALAIPILVPLVHPHPDLTFLSSFLLILGKVFPLLLLPLIAAILAKHLLPKVHAKLVSFPDLAFYLWAIALALAIAVTVKSIVHSTVPAYTQIALATVSLVCCLLQFYLGRKIGRRFGDAISAGQSLGQKNTVLAIWLGYTFFTPVTAVVGGFYSICHNVINSWQLYKVRKKEGTARIPGKTGIEKEFRP